MLPWVFEPFNARHTAIVGRFRSASFLSKTQFMFATTLKRAAATETQCRTNMKGLNQSFGRLIGLCGSIAFTVKFLTHLSFIIFLMLSDMSSVSNLMMVGIKLSLMMIWRIDFQSVVCSPNKRQIDSKQSFTPKKLVRNR